VGAERVAERHFDASQKIDKRQNKMVREFENK